MSDRAVLLCICCLCRCTPTSGHSNHPGTACFHCHFCFQYGFFSTCAKGLNSRSSGWHSAAFSPTQPSSSARASEAHHGSAHPVNAGPRRQPRFDSSDSRTRSDYWTVAADTSGDDGPPRARAAAHAGRDAEWHRSAFPLYPTVNTSHGRQQQQQQQQH